MAHSLVCCCCLLCSTFSVNSIVHSLFLLVCKVDEFSFFKWYHTYKSKKIRDEISLYLLIKRRVTTHRRTEIYFNKPGFKMRVYENIKPKTFEAVPSIRNILLHLVVNNTLLRYYGFYYYVVDFLFQLESVYLMILKFL